MIVVVEGCEACRINPTHPYLCQFCDKLAEWYVHEVPILVGLSVCNVHKSILSITMRQRAIRVAVDEGNSANGTTVSEDIQLGQHPRLANEAAGI